MDLFTLVLNQVKKSYGHVTLDDVGFFRSNARVQEFDRFFKGALDSIVNIIQTLGEAFNVKIPVTNDIELTTTLDFWRNMILGRSGDAHSHLME